MAFHLEALFTSVAPVFVGAYVSLIVLAQATFSAVRLLAARALVSLCHRIEHAVDVFASKIRAT